MDKAKAYADIARRLREFGYPDLTTEKIREIAEGEKKSAVIEAFIKSMLPDYAIPA